jgi:carnitine O-acetyltransferase
MASAILRKGSLRIVDQFYSQFFMRSKSSFPSWTVSMIESNGNYANEINLELHNTPLYGSQSDLHDLPVPSLQETTHRLIPTVLPLALSQKERDSFIQACDRFPGQAQYLQGKLLSMKEERSRTTSWLQNWWNTIGYLQCRDPLVIYVSYFFNLPDDPTLQNEHDTIHNSPQIQRAAALLQAAWEYRQLVCSGALPQETIKRSNQTIPLCSVGFKYLFHSCRIPKLVQDTFKMYDPAKYTHVIVACRGHFFSIQLLDEQGKEFSISTLENSLRECQKLAQQSPSMDFGFLTACTRDEGAVARNAISLLPGMDTALATLESGMLLLCLDEENLYSQQQRARHYWHGNGTSNRWYDKSIQLIVSQNGCLGYVGEHSMMDGMPAVGLCQHLTQKSYRERHDMSASAPTRLSSATPLVKNIFEPVMKNLKPAERLKLQQLVSRAKFNFHSLINSFDMHVQNFQGYGYQWIKTTAGFSPDAYVQMAIQVASYRLFKNQQVATYESTETTRTVSPASNAFCLAMNEGYQTFGRRTAMSRSGEEKEKLRKLLQEAISSHVQYSRLASQAQGVDRHLFGLSMIAQEEGHPLPDLFLDPLHLRAKEWRVSTSTLPGTSPGFGPVCETGVGIGYDIRSHSCIFSITSLKRHHWTESLCHFLEDAMIEMKELSINDVDSTLTRSKL